MTAFKEVLTAEQEAELAIEAAREEVAEAIFNAKNERKIRLDSEAAKLQVSEQSSLAAHKGHIAALVEKIQMDVQGKITTIESRFATHKADIKSKLTKSF